MPAGPRQTESGLENTRPQGAAEARLQIFTVAGKLVQGPVPVPRAVIFVMQDKQVAELFDLGKAKARGVGNGILHLDLLEDLPVPAPQQQPPQLRARRI